MTSKREFLLLVFVRCVVLANQIFYVAASFDDHCYSCKQATHTNYVFMATFELANVISTQTVETGFADSQHSQAFHNLKPRQIKG